MLPYAPWLCWVLPILGALLTPIFAKLGHKFRDVMAVLFSFSAVVMAASMIPDLLAGRVMIDDEVAIPWVSLPQPFTTIKFGVLVDPLSIIIANVVAFISFLIMVYSIGYMHEDPGLTRYWFLMNFFIGSMLLLVLSDNFLQLLIGWEGVGLCSYGLIGYYYQDDKKRWVGGPDGKAPFVTPSHCGMKAFVMTGIGDAGLLIAVFIIFVYGKTFNFMQLYSGASSWLSAISSTPGLLTLVILLLLLGPIGKSAQFPLHEWLPEAMAGPTSVSALIHAATMVKAGVYLVARVSPIFYYGYWVKHYAEAMAFFTAVAWIGIFTAFLAATQAVTALELKKALAYSTISQIGYMMLGLGVAGLTTEGFIAGYTAGVFHLMSHAIFKASLFLGAGAVLHAVESIYMFDMSGVKKSMPLTYSFMLIGALTLAGVPPLIGFWSKDAVFAVCLETGQYALLAVAAVTAAITVFYSIRFISLTFHGKKSKHLRELEHEGGHIHEASRVMWIPYGLLALLAIGLGLAGPTIESFLHDKVHIFLHEVYHLPLISSQVVTTPAFSTPMAISIAMIVLGGVPSYMIYVSRKIAPTKLTERGVLKAMYSFVWNRWYINSAYYKIFVQGTIVLGIKTRDIIEIKIIDRAQYAIGNLFLGISRAFKFLELNVFDQVGPVVARGATAAYNTIRKIQTGILSYNMLYVALGLILLLSLLLLGGR